MSDAKKASVNTICTGRIQKGLIVDASDIYNAKSYAIKVVVLMHRKMSFRIRTLIFLIVFEDLIYLMRKNPRISEVTLIIRTQQPRTMQRTRKLKVGRA